MAAVAGSRNRADIAAGRRKRRKETPWRWLSALRHSESGVSAVEFALASPLLLGLILPLLDLGQAMSEQIRLNLAVQAGAQYASLNLWGGTSSSDIANIVVGAAPNLSISTGNVSATEYCGCPNPSDGPTLYAYPSAPDSCASKYPSCAGDSQPAGVYVQVTAQFSHTAVVPYSASPATLTSTAVVRTY